MRGSGNFFRGGGGGPGPTIRRQSEQRFFSPKLILQFTEWVQWFYYKENCMYTFQRIQRGSNIFQRGYNFFSRGGGGGGFQMLISIETHITRDFPGGGGGFRTPYPPSGSALAANSSEWSVACELSGCLCT